MRKKKTHVVFERESVKKYCSPETLEAEVSKTQQAAAIGKECGLFKVPSIVSIDKKESFFIMDKIDGLTPIRNLTDSDTSTLKMYHRAGEALAIIHQSLIIPDSEKINLPEKLSLKGVNTCLHGDFTKANVCFTKNNGSMELVIIDWQMTSIYGGKANYGTSLFDIAWFLSGLFIEPVIRKTELSNIVKRADSFLDGYMVDTLLDLDEFKNYCDRLSSIRDETNKINFPIIKLMLTFIARKEWDSYVSKIST